MTLGTAALLPLLVALLTLGLKFSAYWLTGSVGLLSDALESVVNLATAVATVTALRVSHRPPDDEHHYGHGKAEYFASGFQGALILVAALSILLAAGDRILNPQQVHELNLGILISALAAALNGGAAWGLARLARKWRSIALEGEAMHLMTDVWTTAGVLVGLGAMHLTGWNWLDSACAIVVALQILRSGAQLLRRSAMGLLDTSLPEEEMGQVQAVLDRYSQAEPIHYHALRTRQAGARRFVSFHVLVPGEWTVQQGHTLLERIESDVRECMEGETTVFTHLEPVEDPCSFDDIGLDRGANPTGALDGQSTPSPTSDVR